jgi:antitoxin (DNA-binding transcriptional repressor) of toxin-antitoxin stability system
MKASTVDLRYKTNEILAALEKREPVTILYHGKPRGTIVPYEEETGTGKVCDHAFFNMYGTETESVEEVMQKLRGGRHDL